MIKHYKDLGESGILLKEFTKNKISKNA